MESLSEFDVAGGGLARAEFRRARGAETRAMLDSVVTNRKQGRPSLGPRLITTTRLPLVVQAAVEEAHKNNGCDRGRFIADIVCLAGGRGDLVRCLKGQQFDSNRPSATETSRTLGRKLTVRLPAGIGPWLEQAMPRNTDRSTFISDLVCVYMGYPSLVRAR